MTGEFSVSEAQLVALFLETLFYGIFIVTFGMAMQAQLLFPDNHRIRGLKEIHWPIFIPSILLFIFASTDAIVQLLHCLKAFITDLEAGHLPDASFQSVPDWMNVIKHVNIVMITCVGDAVMLYRVSVVYARNRKILAVPFVLWLAGVAFAIVTIYLIIVAQDVSLVTASALRPHLITWFIITTAFSFLTTGLIFFRVRHINHDSKKMANYIGTTSNDTSRPPKRTRVQHVMLVIVESGMMYLIADIVTFLLVLVKHNALFPVSDAYVQIVGIAFNLILIRSSNARQSYASVNGAPSQQQSTQIQTGPHAIFATPAELELDGRLNTIYEEKEMSQGSIV